MQPPGGSGDGMDVGIDDSEVEEFAGGTDPQKWITVQSQRGTAQSEKSKGEEEHDKDAVPKTSTVYSGVTPGRTRMYPIDHKGPYVVFIREKRVTLKYVTVAKFLVRSLKSFVSCDKISERKIRVTVSDREEANNLLKAKELEPYRVYVPADEVEVEGVIQVARDILTKELLCEGFGKFEHPGVPNIRPVDVFRFTSSKQLGNGEVMKAGSEFVKVTFPGKALPHFFVIFGLRIRIKLYNRRAMFCEKCGRLDHTELFCNNKPNCRKCGAEHTTIECDKDMNQIVCNLCKGTHELDVKTCPKYQQATRNRRMATKASITQSYSDLVRRMGGSLTQSENVYQILSDCDVEADGDEYPLITSGNPKKRRRPDESSSTRHHKSASGQEVNRSAKKPQRERGKPSAAGTPPGFAKANSSTSGAFDFKTILTTLVNSLQISSQMKSLILLGVDFLFSTVFPMLCSATDSNLRGRKHE